MEKRIIEIDLDNLERGRYNDNLARVPKARPEKVPELAPAPKKGVRTRPLPREKSAVRPMWIAALLAVAVLYMVLVGQYMTLTELSLEASGYESAIRKSDQEISKLKKFTLTNISDEEIEAFVRKYDMDKLERSNVEYLETSRPDVMISHTGKENKDSSSGAAGALGEKLEEIFEFFR
ncbi:MAG: hypothetical protein IJM21_02135 [Clostridia bacterium]|nr:hypothetical protein [Clostridia bacterium]